MEQWKYTSIIQRGLSHAFAGTECQDSVWIEEDATGLVAVLCDGVGSLRYSKIAAETASRAAAKWLLHYAASRENMSRDPKQTGVFARNLIDYTTAQIRRTAEEAQIRIEEMDCTFSFVLISHLSDEVVIGRLGDSAVCVMRSEDSIAFYEKGMIANATKALLDEDAGEHLEILKMNQNDPSLLGFILTSDGLEGEIYAKGSDEVSKNAEQYFNALVQQNPEKVIRDRIAILTTNEETSFDDDISIAVISRTSAPIRMREDPTWLCRCGNRNSLIDTICPECSADFVALYRHVPFIEYGGKYPFFRMINGDPKAEQRVLRGKLQIDDRSKRVSKTTAQRKNKIGRNMFWIGGSMLLALLMVEAVASFVVLFL